jgi:dATP pyrophosphohydrolase
MPISRRRRGASSSRRPAWRWARSPTGSSPDRYEIWPQWRARYAPGVTHNTEHVFGFRVDSPTVATLDPAEHVAQLWLPWQEAMARVFSPTNRDAIRQLPQRVLGHTGPA